MIRRLVNKFSHKKSRDVDIKKKSISRLLNSFITLLCISYLSVCYAGFNLQVDSPSVVMGQTFQIILTLDGPEANTVPDISPLQENFDVVSTERSNNYSIINGQTAQFTQWLITVTPKIAGRVPIPSLYAGNSSTKATSILVTSDQTNPNQPVTTSQDSVQLIASVSDKAPYINQQVVYTVKLLNNKQLLDADYQVPQVENALVIPLGNGTSSQIISNGQVYAVVEQKYAIFPQKSGALKIKPPVLNALVFSTRPEKLRVQANPVNVNVKPIPPQWTGANWLPAKQVRLTEQYDDPGRKLTQGDTVTRTVTLRVVGAPAQSLPALTFNSSKDFSVYPEKATNNNSMQQTDLIGSTSTKITYLFSKAGQVTIPEVIVPWFNVVTGKEENATLPAQTITIAANPSSVPSVQTQKPEQQPESKPKEITAPPSPAEQAIKTPVPPVPQPQPPKPSVLPWLFVLGIALLWLGSARYNRKTNAVGKKVVFKQLQEACQANNPGAAQAAVLQWANWQWPNQRILTLADIAPRVTDMRLKKALNRLSYILYHSGTEIWNGEELWQAIINYQDVDKQKSPPSNLPPLHPGV